MSIGREIPACSLTTRATVRRIAPLMAILLLSFLAVGLMLPALPLHVHNVLGLGAGWLGVVAGSHFLAAILMRPVAGRMADQYGGKPVVRIGLLLTVAGGTVSGLSLLAEAASVSTIVLTLGRGLLGASEGFLITGAIGWGISMVPPGRQAFTISWLGSALFVAFAIAMPLGTLIQARWGFAAVAATTALLAFPAMFLLQRLRGNQTRRGASARATAVIRAVFAPGIALGLASTGYGAMLIYAILLFDAEHWPLGWLAVSGFSAAFVLLRLSCGTLPDRIGGGRTAGISLVVQAAGLVMIGTASGPATALAGAVLTGLGYAFVFPGLGIEALRRVSPGASGAAMAFYTAYLDVALGVGIPALGVMADVLGLPSVFLATALASSLAAVLSLRLGRWHPEARGRV